MYIITGNGLAGDDCLSWNVGVIPTKDQAIEYCNKLNEYADVISNRTSDIGEQIEEAFFALQRADIVLYNEVVPSLFDINKLSYEYKEINPLFIEWL